MRINYNVSSIIARNALNVNDNRLSQSIQRLSSGFKINSAADDAAGLAISIKMNAQIRSLEQANKNANDGISVVNTADGAMSEMHDILQRMNELAIQSANGTNSDGDREQIQLEIDQLVEELDRIAETTQFNAQNLLDGSFAYKGYTNTQNIKVMSYSDGVSSGTYAINQLTYNQYEDTIKDYAAYIEDSPEGEVTTEERFAATSADDIKAALLYDTDIEAENGMKGFPEGSKVIIKDDNVIIQAENDFEVKLSLNDKKAIENSGATTSISKTYISTDCYKNVTVTNADGTIKYNISEINIIKDWGTDKAMDPTVTTATISYHTGSVEEGLRHLSEDLGEAFSEEFPEKEIEVIACEYKDGSFFVTAKAADDENDPPTTKTLEFPVEIQVPNGSKLTEKQYIDSLPDKVQEDNLNYYLYTHTDTTLTEYTVGGGDKGENDIMLNLTGMGPMRVQVGANEGQVIQIEIPALGTEYLGVDGLDISTEEKATEAIDVIADAINYLSGIRSKIGAYCNRIEHTVTNLDVTEENMTASYSRIMDVDMAKEMTEYSTVQVLVESSTAMLAQANERPQSVLQLLQ